MKLSKKDLSEIYDMALQDFNHNIKDKYSMVECIINNFLALSKRQGLEVKKGEIHVATEN